MREPIAVPVHPLMKMQNACERYGCSRTFFYRKHAERVAAGELPPLLVKRDSATLVDTRLMDQLYATLPAVETIAKPRLKHGRKVQSKLISRNEKAGFQQPTAQAEEAAA